MGGITDGYAEDTVLLLLHQQGWLVTDHSRDLLPSLPDNRANHPAVILSHSLKRIGIRQNGKPGILGKGSRLRRSFARHNGIGILCIRRFGPVGESQGGIALCV